MKIHELKTSPDKYRAISAVGKTFEYRLNDRGYEVGDTLILKEWAPHRTSRNIPGCSEGKYTGSEKKATISYLLPMDDRNLNQEDGKFYSHCILGLTNIEIVKIGSPDGQHLSFGPGVVVRPQYTASRERKAMMQAKEEEVQATSLVTSEREKIKTEPDEKDKSMYHYAEKCYGIASVYAVDGKGNETKVEQEEDMIPQPHLFKVTYFPAENYWEILCPEPMSVNDMYFTGKKGKAAGKRILHNNAKLWKEKLKDAIQKEIDNHAYGMNKVDYSWNPLSPMMYQMDWYIRDSGRKQDLESRLKLTMDAISGTAIWKDDSQIRAFFPRTVHGAIGYKGAIRVTVMPWSQELESNVLHPFLIRSSSI